MRVGLLAVAESYYARQLQRAAAGRCELQLVSFSQLTAEVAGAASVVSSGTTRLDQCRAVLVRTMPPGSLEQVVFRMDALLALEARGVAVINSARAVETAVDKYLALVRLQRAGLPVPTTIVCQTPDEALDAFHRLGGDVVVKPLFGGEGRGIIRVDSEDLAYRVFSTLSQLRAVLYLQPFLPHDGVDIRLLVIGRRVIAMRRRHPTDWRTNISRGAVGEPWRADAELEELALRAADAVGAEIAGVDVLPCTGGGQVVLEVNAVPGWKTLAAVSGIDVAALVIDHVLSQLGAPAARDRVGGPSGNGI